MNFNESEEIFVAKDTQKFKGKTEIKVKIWEKIQDVSIRDITKYIV